MIWILIFFVGGFVLYLIDLIRHRHPLSSTEILALALKRRRIRALTQFDFSKTQTQVDPEEKKTMKGHGEFVTCNLEFFEMPSLIAGLLKYKKHEWVVIAFISLMKVKVLWWNKGPDNTMVWPILSDHAFDTAIKKFSPDMVALLHNHPNPFSGKLQVNAPSDGDLVSARSYQRLLDLKGISLLEFVCERGVPHLYYAAFDKTIFPMEAIVQEVENANGKNFLQNRKLRKELRHRTRFDRIAGK